MNKNRNKRIYAIILLASIAFFVIMVFYKREQRTKANYRIGFSGVIYKITKASRQHYDVYVTNGQKCMLFKDLVRRDKGYQIAIGDSLIKPINTTCFVYKRKNIIIFQSCDFEYSFYFSDETIKCP